MNAPGFRLRMILIVIATLAVLMGLGRIVRPGPMRGIYEYLVPTGLFGSQRARFDFQRLEVWIWVDETVDSNGILIEINYLCIPIEYVVTIGVILAAPVILTVNYLARRGTDISRQDGISSVSQGRAMDSPSFRLRTIFIVIATLAVLMILAATMRRGVPLQPHAAKNSKSADKSVR